MNHGLKHRLAIEAGGIGAWERDLLTHVITLSPLLAHMMGLPPDQCELSAAAWQTMVVPEDRPLLTGAALEHALLANRPFDLEFRWIRPDGEIVSFVSRGRFLRNADGTSLKAIGVCFLNKTCHAAAITNVLSSMPAAPSTAVRQPARPLTKQQQEVLRHAVDGKSVRETARALNVSEDTVRQHQRDARKRLGARTMGQAVSMAMQGKLL